MSQLQNYEAYTRLVDINLMKPFFRNPILLFLLNRYVSYGFLFVRGLIIAKFLGTYYFGIWGFLTLVLQYLSYSTFGINYAITVQLSTESQKEEVKNGLYSSVALLSTLILDLLLIGIGIIVQYSGIELFSRFEFNHYVLFIVIIAGLSNLQQVLINIYRVEKKIFRIAIVEIFTAIVLMISALIFRENQLIKSQITTLLLTGILSILILVYQLPFRFRLRIDKNIIKSLFKLGFPLFFYNLSFFLITIAPRSVVSAFYSVEILGFFTLANSIAYSTLLGLQSVAWAIYPEVLSKTTLDKSNESTFDTINTINLLYNTTCFLLVFIVVLLLPILFLYLPQYRPAIPIVTILLLSQAVLATSFGFNALAVSRKKQQEVAIIGIEVVLLITLLSILASYIHLHQIWIAFIGLLGSFIYILFQVRLGSKLINPNQSFWGEFQKMYPVGIIVAIFINIFGSFTDMPIIWSSVALGILIITNLSNIKSLWLFVMTKR